MKICYLLGSQLIWQGYDIYIPSSKMREENFSKEFVVAGHQYLILKRERQVKFLKGLQAIIVEHKTSHICGIINN